MSEPKARIEPGMVVEMTARQMQLGMSRVLTEHDLGMQKLLEDAVEEFIGGGGLARQVQETVNREMPKRVEQAVFRVLYGMGDELEEAVAGVLREQFARGKEER